MNEFTLIEKYFVPLAEPFRGSLKLSDDAALLDIPPGQQLVVTKDAISEGIHFLGTEDPALIARKLLRTNLSDLAAMGATPLCYFLSIALPSLNEDYIARFAAGLAEDQREFAIHLAGGDTIATHGTPTFSITAHGLVPRGAALTRSGAKPSELLYVSGTLGDAALGLLDAKAGKMTSLAERYFLPQPRVKLGESLRGIATSCIDISDGLIADATHLAETSHVRIEIDLQCLPVSHAGQSAINANPNLLPLIYAGGDDYELLFTLPEGAAAPQGTSKIGRVTPGSGVKLMNNGLVVPIEKMGYQH